MIQVIDCLLFNKVLDRTKVTIFDHSGCPLASGNWFQDQIKKYYKAEVIEMTYYPLTDSMHLQIRGSLFDYE